MNSSYGTTLIVSEIFGPTLQGEGPNAGQQATFLRLGGCNLHCSWCDTAYTWRFSDTYPHEDEDRAHYDVDKELWSMPVNDAVARILAIPTRRLVITGGEPLLQQHALKVLLLGIGYRRVVEVETNGTVEPDIALLGRVGQFNVSPKLRHSGNASSETINRDTLMRFVRSGRAIFKFVCQGPDDLDEVETITRDVLTIPPERVWIMPEGRTAEAVQDGLQRLADETIKRGWNLSPRLHVSIWGDRRGV